MWRNKRRSLITMSSIAFGVIFACMMMSLQYGTLDHMMDNAVKFYSGHVQVHKGGYWEEKIIDNSLAYTDVFINEISSIEGVQAAVPRIEYFALAAFDSKTRPSMVFGVDTEKESFITGIHDKMVAGEYLLPTDKAVLISSGLAEYLNINVGDSIILMGQGYHGSNAIGLYPVKGVVKFPSPEQNNRFVCMPVREAQWFYRLDQRLTSIALLLNDSDETDNVMKTVSTVIGDQDLKPINWQAMMPDLVQMVKLKHASTAKMTMVLYIVIGFGMFGTFLMMTAERKYEFGILISIGMKRAKLQFTVFMEILMMSLLGVLAGVLVSTGIITYFYANPVVLPTRMQDVYESYGIEPVIEFSMIPYIFYSQAWAIFLIAVILSFYPLLVLFRLKPVQAMREG
jgi:ABC-type lipoprotein release transport system permease subunit